jgi:DNA-binding response OmpR family regulator
MLENAPATGEILVVDDEPEIRAVLKRLFTKVGHRVAQASSSEEADHWLRSQRFDVMILDCELPGMSGPEFLRWALKQDPELAVIMLTGLNLSDVAVECIEAGARTYLVKPPHPEFLRLAVRDALAVRQVLVERNRLMAVAPSDPS